MAKKCLCGCGGIPPISKYTKKSRQQQKGQRMRFIPGHNNHGPKLATPSKRVEFLRDMTAMEAITPQTSKSEIWDMMVEAKLLSHTTSFEDIGFSRLMRTLDSAGL